MLMAQPGFNKGPSLMKDNASFGGDDEREDLDGLCESLRDELLSDQMSDRANVPENMFERDVEASPLKTSPGP